MPNLSTFSFTKYNQLGSTTNLPGTDPAGAGNPNGNWEVEEALDVEWAHAMAPGANIVLVEANDASYLNLFAAVDAARNLSGVSVVSMSWGSSEFSGETLYDAHFQTPAGHIPITFVAASGDYGTISYPAASPEVLSVGGTDLQSLDLQGDYPGTGLNGEVGWSGSGGGVSSQESLPTYQSGVVPTGTNTNTTMRESPDVAYNAGYGVDVYDSYNNGNATPWSSIGGTSAGAPQWSALIAIANQGRAVNSLTSLNGYIQTLPFLYSAPSTDFHDIIYGQNSGYQAGPGYDMVTGLGTPNAAQVVGSLESLALLPVSGTGVNATGTVLSTTPPIGSGTMPIDPHYTLVTPPSTYTPAAMAWVAHAYVLNSSDWTLSSNGGPYVADGPSAEWISPDRSGSSASEPGGYYDYRTTFVGAQ